MNILLTGSGGFIGKNLKQYLKDKYHLLCPRSFELDLCNTNKVEQYFCDNNLDLIIHCASIGGARGIVDKENTLQDNILMVENLIKFKQPQTRIILFGSGAMYGKDRDLHQIKEDEIGKYIPKDLYGKSKLEISKIVKHRKDILMLNIFACYGYGEKENRFPSYAINQVLREQSIEINQNCIFDYLWVEDMQKIVDYFIKNKPVNNIINITPTEASTLLDIAKIVKSFSKNNINININNPTMNFEYTGNNNRFLEEMPDFKFTPLNVGLKFLYEYNKNRRRAS